MSLRWDATGYWPFDTADRWADAELLGGQHDGHRFKVKLDADSQPPAAIDAAHCWERSIIYGGPQLVGNVWRYRYRRQA